MTMGESDIAIDLLTQIRDLHVELLTEIKKLTTVAEDFGKFANGPMASSPLMKMLGIGR